MGRRLNLGQRGLKGRLSLSGKQTQTGRQLRIEPLELRMLLTILNVPIDYPTIQAAVDVAQAGDTVNIAAGTYLENILINKSGITIQGAGQGQTIIDGQQQDSVVIINNVDATTIFMDCTVRNGLGLGGGIRIINASPIIRHNEIVDNAGQIINNLGDPFGVAGGIYINGDSAVPIIVDNLIQHNTAHGAYGGYGGGLYATGARPIISQNQIIDNYAWCSGGAMYLSGADALIDHNIIKDNHADYETGIVVSGAGETTIQNNLIAHNYGTYKGNSAIYINSGYVSINNNTIVDNSGDPWGEWPYLPYSAINVLSDSVEIRNNIVAYNYGFGVAAPANAVAQYDLVYGNYRGDYTGGVIPGPGSLSVDPQFVDRANGDYHLAPGSPAINAGDPNLTSNDPDGSRNDMGYTGSILFQSGLSTAVQQKLIDYATATLRYFWDVDCNNVLAGFTHSWYGAGPGRAWNSSTQQWDVYMQMPRGYGSYVNVNEVTLGMVSLAVGYKMEWFTDPQVWTRIESGLNTLRLLQTSGDPAKYTNGTFNRWYQTVGPGDVDLPPEQIHSNENIQSSDDNGLAYLNLLNLKGLVVNLGNEEIPDLQYQNILTLIDNILADIHLERFLVNNTIVTGFNNGVPSLPWDRVATEGPLILSALLLSDRITNEQFNQIAPSFLNFPVDWTSCQHGTIPIEFPSYHSAMFMHGLRAIHGMPITDSEFPGATFFEESLKPVFKAHMDYALANHFEALGSQVMSQTLDNWPLVEMPQEQQGRFPGNEDNHMPIPWQDPPLPEQDLPRATASHAWFIAMDRALQLDSGDVEQIIAWSTRYESRFFDDDGLGWEVTIPWEHNDTTYTWQLEPEPDGIFYYCDGGLAHEALNSAYLVISIFNALKPITPLTSYNPESAYLGAIARYFDSNGTQPLGTLVDGNTLDLGGNTVTVPSATLVSGSIVNGTLIADAIPLSWPYVVQSGTIDATLSGTGGLAKIGADTATLSAPNNYTGGTTVLCGTLKAANDNVLPTNGNVTISGGTLDLNGKTDNIGILLLESGNILNGTLYANTYNIESGTVTANLAGPGGVQKTTDAQATTAALTIPSVTVTAGQLTVTSLATGHLSIGAGGIFRISPHSQGPLAASSTEDDQQSLADPVSQPDQAETIVESAADDTAAPTSTAPAAATATVAEPLAESTVIILPVALSAEATPAVSALVDSTLNHVIETLAANTLVADIAPPVRLGESAAPARLIDAVLNRLPVQSPLQATLDPAVLFSILENRRENPLADKQTNTTKTTLSTSLFEESPLRVARIAQNASVTTLFSRQTHSAALRTIVEKTDAEKEFDEIISDTRIEKHARQVQELIDTVLAEEDNIKIKVPAMAQWD